MPEGRILWSAPAGASFVAWAPRAPSLALLRARGVVTDGVGLRLPARRRRRRPSRPPPRPRARRPSSRRAAPRRRPSRRRRRPCRTGPVPREPLHASRAAVASDHPLASAVGAAVLKAGATPSTPRARRRSALACCTPSVGHRRRRLRARLRSRRRRRCTRSTSASARPRASRRRASSRTASRCRRCRRRAAWRRRARRVRGLGELVKRWGKKPFGAASTRRRSWPPRGAPASWRLAQALATLAKEPAPADAAFAKTFIGPRCRERRRSSNVPSSRRRSPSWRAGGPGAFLQRTARRRDRQGGRGRGGRHDGRGSGELLRHGARAARRRATAGCACSRCRRPRRADVALVETLGILDALYPTLGDLPKDGATSPAYLHALAEAFKHAFRRSRALPGRSGLRDRRRAKLTSAAYAADLAKRIKPGAVLPTDAYGSLGGPPGRRSRTAGRRTSR